MRKRRGSSSIRRGSKREEERKKENEEVRLDKEGGLGFTKSSISRIGRSVGSTDGADNARGRKVVRVVEGEHRHLHHST